MWYRLIRCILIGIAMQSLKITRNILFEKIYYDGQQIYLSSFHPIPLFQLNVRWEKCDAVRHYVVIGKHLAISNDRNSVRWAVLGWESTDSFENFSVKSSKRDQSKYTEFNPPLFSLVDTFMVPKVNICTSHLKYFVIWIPSYKSHR